MFRALLLLALLIGLFATGHPIPALGLLGVVAILQMRRVRRGLQGVDSRPLPWRGWTLAWPAWWELPKTETSLCRTGEQDGVVQLLPLPSQGDEPPFRATLDRIGVVLDHDEVEDHEGEAGPFQTLEGPGTDLDEKDDTQSGRVYLWLARLKGKEEDLLILYRSSVVLGFADAFWLQEVARLAAPSASR